MFSKSSLVFALSVLAVLSDVHVALAAPALSCVAVGATAAPAAPAAPAASSSAAVLKASSSVAKAASTSVAKAASTSVAKAASTSVAKAASTSVAKAASTSVAKAASTSVAKAASTSVAKAASTSVAKAASTSVAKAASSSVAKASSVASSVAASSTNVLASTGSSQNATANNANAQDSLTLDPKVIATGFEQNGQETPTAGQIASLTSSNNFINFCLTEPNLPITNGQQITTGSCNPAPMGVIAGQKNMPAAKFTSPPNFGTIPANENFTITIAINQFQAGAFVNAESNYFAAPQTVNSAGNIIGHSHVVVEALPSLGSTTPLDNTKFTFFKGLNDPFSNGNQLSVTVAGGVPAGAYRIATINTAANHQPVLVAVAQHGSVDDMIYFTAVEGGAASTTSAAGKGTTTTSAAAKAATTSSKTTSKNTPPPPPPAKGKNNQPQKGNNNNFRGGRF